MMTIPCTRVLQNQDRKPNYLYHEENTTSDSIIRATVFCIFLSIFMYVPITIKTMTKQQK